MQFYKNLINILSERNFKNLIKDIDEQQSRLYIKKPEPISNGLRL